MRPRPIRPNVYHEIKRCGVYQGDWKYILVPVGAAYILPFVLGLWIYYVPLGVPLGAITLVVLLSLFTFLRAGKPKGWLLHKLDAATDSWSKYRRPVADEYEIEDWITHDAS